MLNQWLNENARQSKPRRLYAFVDSATDASLPDRLFEWDSTLVYRSLFDHKRPSLSVIAPYLLQLDAGKLIINHLAKQFVKAPWGYFVLSYKELDPLHTFFTTRLSVILPDGRKVTFRFYDPRVIKTYYSASTSHEVTQLIGKNNMIIVPDLQESTWYLFDDEGRKLNTLVT